METQSYSIILQEDEDEHECCPFKWDCENGFKSLCLRVVSVADFPTIFGDFSRARIRLLTNNPEKIKELESYGVEVTARAPLEIPLKEHNIDYLKTKKNRFGHLLSIQRVP